MLYKSIKIKLIKISLIAAMAVTVVVAPLLGQYAAPSASAATSLEDLQQKQKDIQKQQEGVRTKLESLKADKEKQEEYKNTLDEQLIQVRQEKYVIQERINALDAQINEKQREINEKQLEIDVSFEQLGKRLNAIYLAGETSTLEVLLHSDNATELMDNMAVVQSITEHDKRLIENLKKFMNEIKDQKAVIEVSRTEVAAAKIELDNKQDEINELVEESNRILAEIGANIDEVTHTMHALDEESEEAEAAINRWFQEYYANQAKQDSVQNQITQNQNKPNQNTNNTGGVISGGVSSSGWAWPCPGVYTITSDFWDNRAHGALDIAGPGCAGSPIVASKAGVVVQVNTDSWGGGYGTYAFVDHGGGYMTVYAHMSSRVVSVGQYVSQGQVLGYIGNTGNSFGAHLHFEVRLNGVKQNPANYISA